MGFGDLPPIEKTQAYLDAAFKKAGEFATQISPEEKARAIRNLLDDVDAKTISDLVKPLKKLRAKSP